MKRNGFVLLGSLILSSLVDHASLETTTIPDTTTTTNKTITEKWSPYAENRNPLYPSCNTDQIEYRLTKLEVQFSEKSENVRSELRENNKRLQALENQSNDLQMALETFRSEIGRISMNRIFPSPQEYKLEGRIDNLATGMQLVVAVLRGVSKDLTSLKGNVSAILNNTNLLILDSQDLATKEFLRNSLLEVKHNQVYRSVQSMENGKADSKLPKNCQEVLKRGIHESGIYRIQPEGAHSPIMVLCDMETRGGGWTYIHNRFEGAQDFYQNWHDYKNGFGNIAGEFWLGLENIHLLTGNEVNELLVELVDHNMVEAHAHYAAFSVGSELEGYPLKVLGGFSGNAGDSLTYHAGSRFSTKDMDQDSWPEGSCAQSHGGAWWYKGCDTSNLNGKYLNGDLPDSFMYQGMYWAEFHGAQYSLAKARMMIRPRDANSPAIFPEGIAGKKN